MIGDNPMYEFIHKIIYSASEIMLSAHDIENTINEKSGDANFVTKYDVEVQNYLYGAIGKAMPDAQIIGEESNDNHMEALMSGVSIIIDPIDGTTNFIHNYRHSAISVGIAECGSIVFGAVYDPYQDRLYAAERGMGSFVYTGHGDKKTALHVSERSLHDSLACFGTSPYYREELGESTFSAAKWMFMHTRDIRRSGSAALDLAYVAAGAVDIFFEYRLSPWDFAAASLLIEEAGGIITQFDNSPITLDKPCPILAGNRSCHTEALAYFNK